MTRTALISFLVNSLNVRALSAYLKENGFEVICLFCPVAFNQSNLNELIEILKEKEISLVGVSLVTDNYHSAVVVTEEIKRKTAIPVIWGGAHVDVRPGECLCHADMVCVGEGEDALSELVRNMSGHTKSNMKIKNIWAREGNEIIRSELGDLEENLDKYPFSDFDLESQYVMNEIGFKKLNDKYLRGVYNIMTSRGCPYACCYCYNNYRRQRYRGKGKYLRLRSIENIIEELVRAKDIFKNLQGINFWDDSFLARQKSDFEKFKQLYLKEIKLPFFILAEPMAFDGEKIEILKECGLSRLQIGIQSGSERVNQEVYNRPILNRDIIKLANITNKLGLKVIYDIIFNNPYENREDIIETIKLLLQFPKPFSLQGYNLIFYPGTEITEKALGDGFISLKSQEEDFSTIQSKNNSPLSARNKTVISSRFYSVYYNTKQKEYLNSLILLIPFNYVSRALIRFFCSSETTCKKALLGLFTKIYITLARIKKKISI